MTTFNFQISLNLQDPNAGDKLERREFTQDEALSYLTSFLGKDNPHDFSANIASFTIEGLEKPESKTSGLPMSEFYFSGFWEDLPIPKEWRNESWTNDACPSWSYNGWHIFVDHPDHTQSECRDFPEGRFSVQPLADYGSGGGKNLNTFEEVLEHIKAYAHFDEACDLANEIVDGGYPITQEALEEACVDKMQERFGSKWDENFVLFREAVETFISKNPLAGEIS